MVGARVVTGGGRTVAEVMIGGSVVPVVIMGGSVELMIALVVALDVVTTGC